MIQFVYLALEGQGWGAKSVTIKVDGQDVLVNKVAQKHTVSVFKGSVHALEAYVDEPDNLVGGFKVRTWYYAVPTVFVQLNNKIIQTSAIYPSFTERDLLRSYLMGMPPTNAFGRAFIAGAVQNSTFLSKSAYGLLQSVVERRRVGGNQDLPGKVHRQQKTRSNPHCQL